jgi:cell division protein FtsW
MLRLAPILLCVATVALVVLGLIMMQSTSVWVRGIEDPYFFVRKQAVAAGIGLAVAIGAVWLSPALLRNYALWGWVGACVLLCLCFVPGIGVEQYGSKRWIQIPHLPQFQPSELAKLVVVISLAAFFARRQAEIHTCWHGFVQPGLIAVVPLGLIAIETDVGSALALAVVAGALLFCAGTRLRYLIPAALMAMAAAAYYIRYDPVRWARIEAWLDQDNPIYHNGIGMQQFRALVALGNGGPWGVGLGEGVEKFGTLTFAHIDFIFPVVGEELGLPFTLGAVLCYVLIAVAGIAIAVQASNLFSRCLALGMTCVIVVPAIVNIAVTTSVLPNDGLPLPFVSFGGTSLVFSMAAVGLLLGVHRLSPSRMKEFPFGRGSRYAVHL